MLVTVSLQLGWVGIAVEFSKGISLLLGVVKERRCNWCFCFWSYEVGYRAGESVVALRVDM